MSTTTSSASAVILCLLVSIPNLGCSDFPSGNGQPDDTAPPDHNDAGSSVGEDPEEPSSCQSQVQSGTTTECDWATCGDFGISDPYICCDEVPTYRTIQGFKCGSDCVDLKSDKAHCGACDEQCDGADVCVAAKCQPPESDSGAQGTPSTGAAPSSPSTGEDPGTTGGTGTTLSSDAGPTGSTGNGTYPSSEPDDVTECAETEVQCVSATSSATCDAGSWVTQDCNALCQEYGVSSGVCDEDSGACSCDGDFTDAECAVGALAICECVDDGCTNTEFTNVYFNCFQNNDDLRDNVTCSANYLSLDEDDNIVVDCSLLSSECFPESDDSE